MTLAANSLHSASNSELPTFDASEILAAFDKGRGPWPAILVNPERYEVKNDTRLREVVFVQATRGFLAHAYLLGAVEGLSDRRNRPQALCGASLIRPLLRVNDEHTQCTECAVLGPRERAKQVDVVVSLIQDALDRGEPLADSTAPEAHATSR